MGGGGVGPEPWDGFWGERGEGGRQGRGEGRALGRALTGQGLLQEKNLGKYFQGLDIKIL